MVPRLGTTGNSLGIVIEKPILELLNIDRETELEMTTNGSRLIIQPMNRPKNVRSSAEKIMNKHDSIFRKSAK